MKITRNQVKVGHGLPAAQAGVPASRIIVDVPPLPRLAKFSTRWYYYLADPFVGFWDALKVLPDRTGQTRDDP